MARGVITVYDRTICPPSASIISAYTAHGARIWLVLRLVVSAMFLLGGLDPWRVGAIGAAEVVLLSVGVSILDTYRHQERAWLGNLGVHPAVLCGLFAFPALIGELVIVAVGVRLR